MPAPSTRLGHRKSRNGCLRCKARHVKCDELRPCSNCVRFDLTCSLTLNPAAQVGVGSVGHTTPATPAPAPTLAPSLTPTIATQSQAHLGVSSTASPSPRQGQADTLPVVRRGSASSAVNPPLDSASPVPVPPPTPASLVDGETCQQFSPSWMQSLRLLHHYSTVVYPALGRDETTVTLWKTVVPEIAFSHEFLMHGLLAMSALHYARSHPEQRRQYVLVSSYYQNLALQYFATRLHDINEDNCEAFFLLSTFIFIITMCSIADPQDLDTPISPRDIAQSFTLLQGIKTILAFKPLERWREQGPLAPILQPWAPVKPTHSGPFLVQMDRVSNLARDIDPSFEVINPQSSCLLAIESLRTTYHSTNGEDNEKGIPRRMWLWPITLTNLFNELIGNNHPVALIILAHFAALARPFERQDWVNQGWSRNIIEAVSRGLGEEWQQWVAWPRRSVQECINVDDMDV